MVKDIIKLPNRRHLKNYLINRHDQLKIALITIIYMSVIVILTVGVVLYPSFSDIVFSEDLDTQYRASQAFLLLLNRLLPAVLIIFILVVLHQILITHRIWGPLCNLTYTIKMVGTGDFSRKVFVRKDDFLKNQSLQVNEMIEALSSHLSNIRQKHARLTAALDEVSKSMEKHRIPDEFEAGLKKIRSQAELLEQDLYRLKLASDTRK